MKILFWTDGFWPRLGGIETMGYQFIEGLQKRGHQCLIIAQKDHPSWQEEETYKGITIRRFDFNAIIAKQELKAVRSIQDFLQKIETDFKPDIIHLNACIGGSAFAFLLFRKLFQAPVVLTTHAPQVHEEIFSPLVKKIASTLDRICCVSGWVLNEMEKHLPALKSRLKLIYNGLPMPTTVPSPLPFSPPTLLLFGRLSWEKGFDTAIEAFSILKQRGSNARLIIAGGGPERKALEKLVGELDLNDSVKFTGILSEEEVFPTYNQATLVIVPSIIESFGLVILESMQMQRPVIASRVEGVPEVISEGETGLMVPMKDPMAFCLAIESLLAQPEKAIEMGIKGRQRALKFSLDQNVLEYENVYKELV